MSREDKARRRRKRKDTARRTLPSVDGTVFRVVGACCPTFTELEVIVATGRLAARHDDDCVVVADPASPAGTRARTRLMRAVAEQMQQLGLGPTLTAVQHPDGEWRMSG